MAPITEPEIMESGMVDYQSSGDYIDRLVRGEEQYNEPEGQNQGSSNMSKLANKITSTMKSLSGFNPIVNNHGKKMFGKKHHKRNGFLPGRGPSVTSVPGSVGDQSAADELFLAIEMNRLAKLNELLRDGVDPNAVTNDKGRWPLHFAAQLGRATMASRLIQHGAELDQPDVSVGCTALHLAANNSVDTLELLIKNGADINAHNKYGLSALHYSSASGQPACSRLLAESGCKVNSIDHNRVTPLHISSRIGDIWTLEVLLSYGADVNARDSGGKIPLHHVAEGGGKNHAHARITENRAMCIRRLVEAGSDVAQTDDSKKTPLWYAVAAGDFESVKVLHELGAMVQDAITLLTISRTFPRLVRPFLDRAIRCNKGHNDVDSKHTELEFDFSPLTFYPRCDLEHVAGLQNRSVNMKFLKEMGALHGLLSCRDINVLRHPLCEYFLMVKWAKMNWYLHMEVVMYAIFLVLLTAVIFRDSDLRLEVMLHETLPKEERNETELFFHESPCTRGPWDQAMLYTMWCLLAILMLKEIFVMLQISLRAYCQRLENVMIWSVTTLTMLLSITECGHVSEQLKKGRDHIAAILLILAWIYQVLLWSKIPMFGAFTVMIMRVSRNTFKCILMFSGLLFGFALTFQFLFQNRGQFSNVGLAALKTLAIMMGEMEFSDMFVNNSIALPHTSHLIMAAFLILASIIFMNLLIGISVTDINTMMREGQPLRMIQQIRIASQMEGILQRSSYIFPKLKCHDDTTLEKRKMIVYPNGKHKNKVTRNALHIVFHQKTNLKGSVMENLTQEELDEVLHKLKGRLDTCVVDVEKRTERMKRDMDIYERLASKMELHLTAMASLMQQFHVVLPSTFTAGSYDGGMTAPTAPSYNHHHNEETPEPNNLQVPITIRESEDFLELIHQEQLEGGDENNEEETKKEGTPPK